MFNRAYIILRQPEQNYWMPGEGLLQRNPRFHPSPMVPHSPSDDELSTPHTSNKAKILELLKGIQEGVENKFSSIADKIRYSVR